METIRKPFQGVWNIIRFNRHFFISALLVILALACLYFFVDAFARPFVLGALIIIITLLIIPLAVSWYVYDLSGLYRLNWVTLPPNPVIANINAGFDEISSLLHIKFTGAQMHVFDFYDPAKHTEVSIKRAREAYPPYPGTQNTTTAAIALDDDCADAVFLFLSAHEIRNKEERVMFFSEARRIVKPGGKIYVTEHLRDIPNLLAYNMGFFHFHSKSAWLETFRLSGLQVTEAIKNNPFITTFTLIKNGDTL